MKGKLSVWAWLVAVAVFYAILYSTAGALPDRVATHFNGDGLANGWMSRAGYLQFITVVSLGSSLVTCLIFYAVRFFPPSTLNVPNADYWRSPEHYPEACDYLFWSSFSFDALLLLWLGGLHYFTVQANQSSPAQLNMTYLIGLTCIFGVGEILWVIALVRYFKKIDR